MGEEHPPYYELPAAGPDVAVPDWDSAGPHYHAASASDSGRGAIALTSPHIFPPQFNLPPDGSYGCELILYDGNLPIMRGTGVGLTRKTARKNTIANVVRACNLHADPRERTTPAPEHPEVTPFVVVVTRTGVHSVLVPTMATPSGPLNPMMAGAAVFGACALIWPGASIRLVSLRRGKTVGGMDATAAAAVLAAAKAAAEHKSGIEER